MNHGDFIESICPVDIELETSDGTGEKITCIPDYTIRALLNELSREKGNNIVCASISFYQRIIIETFQTLFLDSCHSGGANRDGGHFGSKGYRNRQYLNPPLIPQNCDSDIVKSGARGADQAFGFQGQDLDSHIAIAACSSEQSAFEVPGSTPPCGVFTRALTTVLREKSTSQMSYISLISHISAKIKSQTDYKPV